MSIYYFSIWFSHSVYWLKLVACMPSYLSAATPSSMWYKGKLYCTIWTYYPASTNLQRGYIQRWWLLMSFPLQLSYNTSQAYIKGYWLGILNCHTSVKECADVHARGCKIYNIRTSLYLAREHVNAKNHLHYLVNSKAFIHFSLWDTNCLFYPNKWYKMCRKFSRFIFIYLCAQGHWAVSCEWLILLLLLANGCRQEGDGFPYSRITI